MRRKTALERLRGALYPFVRQNQLSDDLLQGPAVETGALDASLDVFARGGLFLEPYTVRVQANSAVITQEVPTGETARNWTTRFKVGDEIIIGGSLAGQSGSYPITAVTSTTLTVSTSFMTTETGLAYAKATYKLLHEARDMMLLPNGFETDTQLRALLAEAVTTHQRRGSSAQAIKELEHITLRPLTPLPSLQPLEQLGTAISYTASTKKLSTGAWDDTLAIGDSLFISGPTPVSSGRYTVYDIAGGVTVGKRAVAPRSYPTELTPDTVEVHFREDRELDRLYWRAVNTTSASATITPALSVSGANSVVLNATAGASATFANGVWSGTWTVPPNDSVELVIQLSNVTTTTTFQAAVTGGAVTAIRLGEACLSRVNFDETRQLTNLVPWRWGGIMAVGFETSANVSGLTVYRHGRPGWFLEITHPGQPENDAYTIASPDEYAVFEVDHRNSSNYSDNDLIVVNHQWLTPADTDVFLGFI